MSSDIFSGKVRDISSQGLGVVDHPDGRAFFVRGAWPGDEGDFRIESLEKKYGFARVEKLSVFSQARVSNPCPHWGLEAGRCGGCSWLGISYKAQLEQKQKMITYLLARTRIEDGVEVFPIWASPQEMGYRNRAQFKTDGEKIGYVSPGSKTIAPIEDCLVLNRKNRDHLEHLRGRLPQPSWAPTPPYLWNYLEVDDDMESDEIQLSRRRAFKQANTAQNLRMREWVQQNFEKFERSAEVIELFAGSGNFTQVLSEMGFRRVHALEVDARAVEALKQRELAGVTAEVCDLFWPQKWKPLIQAAKDTEILLLDPPREGFKFMDDFVFKFKQLRQIFYISCDPQSFAMQARSLHKIGWKLKSVQPVDQFPQTPHVELLAHFERPYKNNR